MTKEASNLPFLSSSKSKGSDICLIIPPSPFLADERVFPFLGVLKVASSLEDQGADVDVLDLSGIKNYTDVIKAYQELGRTRMYGITATSPQFPQAVRIQSVLRGFDPVTNIIKDHDPKTKIIFGGAHATMVGSAYNLDQKKGVEYRGTRAYRQMVDRFDVSVVGDGELAIFEALKDSSPRVIQAGEMDDPFFLQKGTLDNYPFPARKLIDLSEYHYWIDDEVDGKIVKVPAQSMIAQLGCPYECGFCGGRNTRSFRLARTRSIESIMEEVDILVTEYGKRGIMFYDDELNINHGVLVELMESLIRYQEEHKLALRLRGFVKANLFNQAQADVMYRAGFRVLLSGVESGDEGMLKTMRKKTTTEINANWVRMCHKAGLKAKALMSIGHPGETEETVQNSLDWVLKHKPDDVDWTIITEYPGSPYYDDSEPHPTQRGVWVYTESKTGNVLFSQEVDLSKNADFYKGMPGEYTSHVWTEDLSRKRLTVLRDRVEAVSRRALNLPPIQAVAARQFEHSMGQGLPASILRSTR